MKRADTLNVATAAMAAIEEALADNARATRARHRARLASIIDDLCWHPTQAHVHAAGVAWDAYAKARKVDPDVREFLALRGVGRYLRDADDDVLLECVDILPSARHAFDEAMQLCAERVFDDGAWLMSRNVGRCLTCDGFTYGDEPCGCGCCPSDDDWYNFVQRRTHWREGVLGWVPEGGFDTQHKDSLAKLK